MASEEVGVESRLVRLCIEAASESEDSVEKWRRQRRTLERMPPQLAEALLRHLLRRRLLFPSLLEFRYYAATSLKQLNKCQLDQTCNDMFRILENKYFDLDSLGFTKDLSVLHTSIIRSLGRVFKHSIEEIDFRGEKSVDAEWMAYLGAFRFLRSLNVADCHRITNSALWSIAGMTTLKELDLSRCSKVTDAGIRHLLSVPTLEKLCISEIGLMANGVKLLSSLRNLSVLDLGGLPVTDQALSSLQVLTKLQYLDLWGSKISNKGVAVLNMFPKLSFLNLAWTNVTKLPNLSSIACLNMSNCTIHSIFEGDGDKNPLAKLLVSGSTFANEPDAFLYIETSFLSFLDASNCSLRNFCFLPYMNALKHLDLSFSMMEDDSVKLIASIGANLRNLNLCNTRVSSAGVGILAGHVPNLEVISLSHTPIDDAAILYISMMPSVKVINLSTTNVKGFTHQVGDKSDWVLSLTALQSLNSLERLDLEETQVRDAALYPLSGFQMLSDFSLKSVSLTDMSLYHSSSLPKLKNLGIRDAVLTNGGLESFKPPATLKMLDLRGCWLLTKDAILSFGEYHPQVEVKHELVHILPADPSGSNHSSPSRITSRTSQVKRKQGKMPMSPSRLEGIFIDQRLKYTREELLALQTSSLTLDSPHDRGIVIPKMQMD